MWEQLHRVIKPNGAIVLFGSEPFSSALRMSNIKNYKYDWVWKKERGTGFQIAKYVPMREVENICVFCFQNKRVSYNPQMVKLEKSKWESFCGSRSNSSPISNSKELKRGKKLVTHRHPKNILEFSRDKGFHPTQKPVKLIEYLIKTYTQENETVLDFTSGSGTTAIACLNTNRNYICIEQDETYFNQSLERIKNHKIQGEML